MWRSITAELLTGALAAACVGAIAIIAARFGLQHSDVASLIGAAFGAAVAVWSAVAIEAKRRRDVLAQSNVFLETAVNDARAALHGLTDLMGTAPQQPTRDDNRRSRTLLIDLIAALEAIDSLKDQTAMLDTELMRRCHRIIAVRTMEQARIGHSIGYDGMLDHIRGAGPAWRNLLDALD